MAVQERVQTVFEVHLNFFRILFTCISFSPSVSLSFKHSKDFPCLHPSTLPSKRPVWSLSVFDLRTSEDASCRRINLLHWPAFFIIDFPKKTSPAILLSPYLTFSSHVFPLNPRFFLLPRSPPRPDKTSTNYAVNGHPTKNSANNGVPQSVTINIASNTLFTLFLTHTLLMLLLYLRNIL